MKPAARIALITIACISVPAHMAVAAIEYTVTDLGTLGGAISIGNGINSYGNVAGYSIASGVVAHAFLYDGAMHDLGTLGGTNSEAHGINDSGQVAGSARTMLGQTHAFLWTPDVPNGATGTMIDLGTLGGSNSEGLRINDGGQVTGNSYTTPGDFVYHAFLYDGAMHDLGTLGGTYSSGYAINGAGHVVGRSDITANAAVHAFLYTEASGMIDLNLLIDPLSGWVLIQANAINDGGQITGFGFIGNETHAFLLHPIIPEPSTIALAIMGFLGCAASRLRLAIAARR